MSKIGKQPIVIPEGLNIKLEDEKLTIKGPNASLTLDMLPGIKAEITEKELIFTPMNKSKQTLSNWGTIRSLANNAVFGASKNFVKELIIEGVGYRAVIEGQKLTLYIGFSHPVIFDVPETIKIEVEKNLIRVSGPDKELVGQVAANIRKFKKPEPYKGKGIRYSDEVVRRKAGKKAVTTSK